MPHSVTLAARSSVDGYGKPTYGAGTAYQCHIERKTRVVRGIDGQERVSGCAVYLSETAGITPLYRITLPDGTQPTILAVDRFADRNGDYFEVVYC
jgi:hypothetical protein